MGEKEEANGISGERQTTLNQLVAVFVDDEPNDQRLCA